jgi:hypothetical protein
VHLEGDAGNHPIPGVLAVLSGILCAGVRIPMMSAGHSEMMSATVSDPSRPAVPIDVGRVAHRPLDWFGVSMVLG